MSADTFLQNLTDVLFVLVFAAVLVRTIRRPHRANLDASLLFGAVALIVAETWIGEAVGGKPSGMIRVAVASLAMALPYLTLRLIDNYTEVRREVMAGSALALAACVGILAAFHGGTLPITLTLILVAYFAILSGYVAFKVIRAARDSSGVTRRRMRAVALGTALLALVVVLAGLQPAFPHSPMWIWRSCADTLSLACGLAYFVGFAPPRWLRRTWQEPELRAFLSRAASLPRLPDTSSIVHELEFGAASSLGTGYAVIGLWNRSAKELQFQFGESETRQPLVDGLAREVFETQRPMFSADAANEYPTDAPLYRQHRVNSVLSVPITAGRERLGVLSIYAARSPIFAEDDLKLAQLLADQAAVILESRALIDEASRVRAREEATRLKDDFLSAAAHDLKTPLTAVIAQAQLMELHARRDPTRPADPQRIGRIVHEAQRLRFLVTELLDVSRVEEGKLLDKREKVDLAAVVRGACERHSTMAHPCAVSAPAHLEGMYDRVRIAQLIDNLLENAVKYSPDGGTIEVGLKEDRDVAHLTVTDTGIGIPTGDLDRLFDRFHRGTNVDDRRFAGMGLGLFICRGIVEQHGGRMWAMSEGENQGSTFHVELPLPSPKAEVVESHPEINVMAVVPGDAP